MPVRFLEQLLEDVRLGSRVIARRPGFSISAILALAIGIGVCAAIFSVADTVLVRPMPFPHADRLYIPLSVKASRHIRSGSIAYPDYTDWRQKTDVFAGVAVLRVFGSDWSDGTGSPTRVTAAQVSGDFFRVEEARPLLGRTLDVSDAGSGAPDVAVLGYSLWQQRFGSDPSVLGRARSGSTARRPRSSACCPGTPSGRTSRPSSPSSRTRCPTTPASGGTT